MSQTHIKPNRRSPLSTPRGVKVFVILHLTDFGLGGHTPLIEHGVLQP